MSFGSIIKQLRVQNDLTQERLAEMLSISPQAVSRWEQNAGMPDISLLPALANIFDVTTDTLLEVDVRQKEARIKERIEEAYSFSKRGHWNEAIRVLRDALKTYPRSYLLMHRLAVALHGSPQENGCTQEEFRRLCKEAASLEETVIRETDDAELKNHAIAMLCMLCGILETPERAVPYASILPSIIESKEECATYLYRGQRRAAAKQRVMQSLFNQLLLHIRTYTPPDIGVRNSEEWHRTLISLQKKAIALIELLIEDGNYGFFRQKYCWTELKIAEHLAALGEKEEALQYLADAAKHAVTQDTAYRPEDTYTCLLFRGMEFGGVSHNIKDNDAAQMLNILHKPYFDGIREDARFREIEAEMARYASQR